MMNKFIPKTAQEEYSMFSGDDSYFSNTKKYILPLVSSAINRFNLKDADKDRIQKEILEMIPLAVERFLSNGKNIENKLRFSVYFTWYIHDRIKKERNILIRFKKYIRAIFR